MARTDMGVLYESPSETVTPQSIIRSMVDFCSWNYKDFREHLDDQCLEVDDQDLEEMMMRLKEGNIE